MSKEILSRLDVLAAKLGQTAAALWPHAVRHTAIEATTAAVLTVLAGLLAAALIAAGSHCGSKNKWAEGVWIGPLAGGVVLAIMVLMTGAIHFPGNIAAALEPTGHTIKAIIKGVR